MMRLSAESSGVTLLPNMRGTLGPYTSASSSPTVWPSLASARARLTASVVLPTPPLPEPTAMMASTPGSGCGPWGACACEWDIGIFDYSRKAKTHCDRRLTIVDCKLHHNTRNDILAS